MATEEKMHALYQGTIKNFLMEGKAISFMVCRGRETGSVLLAKKIQGDLKVQIPS